MPKWRTGSLFGPGPRVPLCRERRAQFKARLALQRRPGRLTIAAAVIGRVLVDMLGADGRLDPALQTIADKARVSVATVKRALVQLRDCGFVSWTRRLVRDAASRWRTEQASNAYGLSVPSCEAQFAPAVRRKDSLSVQCALSASIKPTTADIAAAQEALALRRAVVVARLLGKVLVR